MQPRRFLSETNRDENSLTFSLDDLISVTYVRRMLTVTVTTRGQTKQRYFRGISSAARRLGVSRQHLYLVLMGERTSPRIEREVCVRAQEAGHGGRAHRGVN